MTSWSLFPPQTREVQLDEKWSFVQKKEENCEPAEPRKGDNWDHIAFDPEHRLVVSMVPGKRTKANVERLVEDFARRTDHRLMNLITSDEYKPYKQAILRQYGRAIPQPRRFSRGRKPLPKLQAPEGLVYATVHKTRRKGRVVRVEAKSIFGTNEQVQKALEMSSVSTHVNIAFIERNNATGRHRNARKVRKTYRFSKDWDIHNGMTWLEVGFYNFCWPVRSLDFKGLRASKDQQTPAMAAGLADHIWTAEQWFKFPAALHPKACRHDTS